VWKGSQEKGARLDMPKFCDCTNARPIYLCRRFSLPQTWQFLSMVFCLFVCLLWLLYNNSKEPLALLIWGHANIGAEPTSLLSSNNLSHKINEEFKQIMKDESVYQKVHVTTFAWCNLVFIASKPSLWKYKNMNGIRK